MGLGNSLAGRYIADGFCILFNKELYREYRMDEKYPWFYALAKTESLLLKNGYEVRAVKDHDHLVRHFGGKSGTAFRNAKNASDLDFLYDKWLSKCKNQVIPIFDENAEIGNDLNSCYKMRGMFNDRWCAPVAEFKIKTGTRGQLKINCWAPKADRTRNTIHITVNGKRVKKAKMCVEHFSMEFPAPKNKVVSVTLRSDYYFKADLPDRRNLSYIISNIESS